MTQPDGPQALRQAATEYETRAGKPTILAGWLRARANRITKEAPAPVWESWEHWDQPSGPVYYKTLDGTAGQFAAALAALPPDTSLADGLGGYPFPSDGEGIWYYPKTGKASIQ